MKNSNRSFDVLQSIDGIKEMSLEELRDILQALNEKVKSSLALRCNYLESDFAAFLEDAASDCAFQMKKEQDQAERDLAEYDVIMENGSRRQREDAFYGDRSNASERVAT